ncbi:hypothetical protein EV363DRAFT_1453026 [Boletus edulis]|uniref:Ricin B lectin domain-containing protein n=1 Tax=Boletus edulis BED1 TaxID=1328754 RepID=A0AAD4BUI5_BOLED|nr:hypothetical protein EV363DRAFT_1453026 [Boletus edulis]KAF8414850.1 hypothetical protein L210DRAFT_3658339 [Boletus edulis BED1]KAF8439708.1 hypothetical protein L210DRAFT_947850 [Boletus edulis BED1]
MAPFIPNGVYVIRNVASDDVVCLKDGIPGGLIVGRQDGPGYPCERLNLWRINNIGGGGNQVTIESVCIPGIFANADESEDAPLFGTPARTIWTIVKVDRGYYLQSPDADFVWQFDAEGAPILLVHHTGEDNTRWVFVKV